MTMTATSMNASSRRPYTVYADLRWPVQTGIGNVMTACLERAPRQAMIEPLDVHGAIGSPLSPVSISKALLSRRSGSVFWSPGFVPPAWASLPSVVTVHDLTHRHFYSRLHRTYYDLLLRRMYRRCTAIVCATDCARNEFLEWSGIDARRVHVVRNGVSPEYARNEETLGLPYSYVLYPGNRRNYKNLDRLLTAYAQSALPGKGIHLVLTGNADQHLSALAERLSIQPFLKFVGRVADEDMPRLYRGSLFVAFISLYEGFGLPIIEAMASRVPVLTSTVSAMPEVAGNAALLVDPLSVPDIRVAMNRLAEEPALRKDLVGAGIERAKRFSWDETAAGHWSIVEDVSRAA
jgi:glycosyltransferase involved in cell wall biosynthesis